MRGRLEHDLEYVRNWSLWLDVKILVRTVAAVLSRKNAY
jgi:putative colanic acid biosynthesis UDP-glucose lipid carrier transferase